MYHWYIVKCYHYSEKKTAKEIKERVKSFEQNKYVKKVLVPTTKSTKEEVFKPGKQPANMKNSENIKWETMDNGDYKKITTVNTPQFPGYIFVNMEYNDHIWHTIRSTPGVLGFIDRKIGKNRVPVEISDKEFKKAYGDLNENNETVEANETTTPVQESKKIVVLPNMVLEIKNGKFAGQTGKVLSVNNETNTATLKSDDGIEMEVSISDLE